MNTHELWAINLEKIDKSSIVQGIKKGFLRSSEF